MPTVDQSVHVDRLLSEVSVKYQNSEYIADRVFPIVPVKQSSNLYRVYQRNFRIPETKRAQKALAREFNFDVSNASYILEEHALKQYIGDDEQDNYDIGDLRADMTNELTDALMRMREKKVADLFTSTNWSLNFSMAASNTFANSTVTSYPVQIFDTAATTVIANSGYKPNFVILPREVFVAVKNHTMTVDRIKYTSAEISESMIAGMLGVAEVLTPIASYDSSQPGVTEAISGIYADIAFMGYKPAAPGPLQPSCGYIFEKNIPRVRRWREEERRAEAIEVDMMFQPKIVASLTGYLILNAV